MVTTHRVGVLGLGYVGLPLALLSAMKGNPTVGYDISADRVTRLREKRLPLQEAYLDTWMRESEENLRWSDEEDKLRDCSIKIVCVPTPVNERYLPDLSFVRSATEACARTLKDGDLVIIESTIYPGTCEEIVAPILDSSGKKYSLAHCPERINPGDPKWNVSNIPRVVGGIDEESTVAAKAFYEQVLDAPITQLSQIKAAEATKILENTFRDVNIAFVNEMAQSFYRLGIDTKEVIRGASTKPFAFMPHWPGAGVGGHCIAVDPYYMIEKGKELDFQHDFLIQARRINSGMPAFTVSLVQDGLNEAQKSLKGSTVAVLGVSYKPDVADDRESPFYKVRELLAEKGADIRVFDPFFPALSTHNSLKDVLMGADCAVIVTAHSDFCDETLYNGLSLLVDGRNCLDKQAVRSGGTLYRGIGIR